MNFIDFKLAVQKQFDKMVKYPLFRTSADKYKTYELYLESFPEGTNPKYRERTEHDCSCCKQFIRTAGAVVAVVDNKLVSIWDINVGGYYQVVADALSKFVKKHAIENAFLHYEPTLGTDFNHQQLENGEVIKWSHFYYKLPSQFVLRKDRIDTVLGDRRANRDVFKRSLEEISLEACDIVLDLIDQKSLYRGEEHKGVVESLRKYKVEYDKLPGTRKDNYVWLTSFNIGQFAKMRNTVIGTLLVDISEGVELDVAVKSYETKVAPANYKRPTALITKKMIDGAQKKVDELGLEPSLARRHAVKEDITINNVLFADRDIKKAMNPFDDLAETVKVKADTFKKVEEVDVATFVKDILPKVNSMEVLVENKHSGNFMSLIAPVHKDAKLLFKWNNNFSWAYNGELADSIKERVKNAGGNVEGVLRCSLSWFNYDDLDLHCVEPGGNEIAFFSKRSHVSDGHLDVDMNAGGGTTRQAVENIIWTNKSKMKEGTYKLFINNYRKRESIDVGFEAEIECNGELYTFAYDKALRDGENVQVAKFKFSRTNGIEYIESLPSTTASREIWGIATNNFQKVSMVMLSPNYWDEQGVGNKHWFFILDKCKNDLPARGFFNEFLNGELTEHRKVLEVLGSKMKVPVVDEQLSGLGFSSTQRNELVCKVSGSFSRTIKIKF